MTNRSQGIEMTDQSIRESPDFDGSAQKFQSPSPMLDELFKRKGQEEKDLDLVSKRPDRNQ